MPKTDTPTVDIDLRGQICPSSLLMALKAVNQHRQALREGTISLVLTTDNRDSTATIPGAVRNMGYQVDVRKISGFYELQISTPR